MDLTSSPDQLLSSFRGTRSKFMLIPQILPIILAAHAGLGSAMSGYGCHNPAPVDGGLGPMANVPFPQTQWVEVTALTSIPIALGSPHLHEIAGECATLSPV